MEKQIFNKMLSAIKKSWQEPTKVLYEKGSYIDNKGVLRFRDGQEIEGIVNSWAINELVYLTYETDE